MIGAGCDAELIRDGIGLLAIEADGFERADGGEGVERGAGHGGGAR